MTYLYNCKHDGDLFRVTKFDGDFNVESSYLCTLTECDCPAGHRPRCRHREMLPKFIQREHVGDEWFFDYDRGGWVQGASRDLQEPQKDSSATDPYDAFDYTTRSELAPKGLDQASGTSLCQTPEQAEEAMKTCDYWNGRKSLSAPEEPSPSIPRPTIRRRV